MLKYANSDLFKKTTANAFDDATSENKNQDNFDRSPEELVEDLKMFVVENYPNAKFL